MTLRDNILAAIATALVPLAPEVEIEPAGDPSEFPSLGLVDSGHAVLEREADATRRQMMITVEGFVEGGAGEAPTAERNALADAVVAAVLGSEDLADLIELVDDDDRRNFTATLATSRRLGFAQDFLIQFTTSRANPAEPA